MKTKQKVCKVCNRILPLSMFYTGKTYTDGYRPVCKSCTIDKYNPNVLFAKNIRIVDKNLNDYVAERKTKKISYGKYVYGHITFIARNHIMAISVHGAIQVFTSARTARLFLINETRKANEHLRKYLKEDK